jgi:hypothetical protein
MKLKRNALPIPQKEIAKTARIKFAWGLKIPMRDGIHLNATIYAPKDGKPVPAIFTLTPYVADGAHARGIYFAQHGYVFAAIDARGRGNSEGTFEPFANEPQDACDCVEWLAVQPWCDGRVAMWGGSYGGYVQWMALREAPPHLATIVPTASAAAGVDFPFYKNIFFSYEIQWQMYVSGVTRNMNIMNDAGFWIGKFQEMYQGHLPFKEIDRVVGNTSTFFQTWVAHPFFDKYWEKMAFPAKQYDGINIPILTITGHYDDDQPGAMEYYRKHMASNASSKDDHYLVIGPWDHAGTRDPKTEFGGLKFSEASILDMNKLHQEWYDWRLKGGKKPSFLKKRVAYYIMGEDKWKYADSLETIPIERKMLYLSSSGDANDVFHSGSLLESGNQGAPFDSYVYDPLDKRYGELEEKVNIEFLASQIYDLNLFGNGLVYHSQPFQKNVEITGWVKLCAWISMDVPDTDFTASLSEILADGKTIKLTQDYLRARYRQSNQVENLVTPGEINLYTFDGFTFFSRRISKGSRLRLIISCPNSIYIEKNYNSGGVVAEESARDARTAHVTLYHDQDHPSYLEIPVIV